MPSDMTPDLAPNMKDTLFQAALEAQHQAYAPYSKFKVGVALLTTQDEVMTGCNVENASYGLTQCAEATAIGTMITTGMNRATRGEMSDHRQLIKAVVIVGSGDTACTPCGACRQRLYEFGDSNTMVYMGNGDGILKEASLGELLPEAFTLLG